MYMSHTSHCAYQTMIGCANIQMNMYDALNQNIYSHRLGALLELEVIKV